MKKARFLLLLGLLFSLTSAGLHKFYVSIYQVVFVPEKKMLQITSRIFIDDLNNAIALNDGRKAHVSEADETPEDLERLKNYIFKHFTITINGKKMPLVYKSKELEGNVVICYFTIEEISKINTIEIENSALIELNSDQQNIIQTTINGKKQSLLLKEDNAKGMLKF